MTMTEDEISSVVKSFEKLLRGSSDRPEVLAWLIEQGLVDKNGHPRFAINREDAQWT